MKLKITLMLASLVFSTIGADVSAQSVRGRIYDKKLGEPMQFVNVAVVAESDTANVTGNITDVNGNFRVEKLKKGTYTLKVSFLGYKPFLRKFSIRANQLDVNVGTIRLDEDLQTLGETVVAAQRSGIKLEVDRKSFDISEQIAAIGASATEALEQIPSVEVDNDGNISLRGNTSVEIWINGKASGLTSDNRSSILDQLPAESIDHIEVIDNPSAKFSAEGSAGIINIVLKKNRAAGYYGAASANVNTEGRYKFDVNINWSAGKWEGYGSVGFRHMRNHQGGSESQQLNYASRTYQDAHAWNHRDGNNLFFRAGATYHITDNDEITLSGMAGPGKDDRESESTYLNGPLGTDDTRLASTSMMLRRTSGGGKRLFWNAQLNYRHTFAEKHTLEFNYSMGAWSSDDDNIYQDSTVALLNGTAVLPALYSYTSRPTNIRNRNIEAKVDYSNQITERFKLETGYQFNNFHENTPQESEKGSDWKGADRTVEEAFFNRFIYDSQIHAFYATGSMQFGPLGVMLGMRGEYWRVNTESYNYAQEHNAALRDDPFKKDYFELFPSVFLSYQLTPTQQLQLNYTRRLRRPWGGELNSFKNTSDASMTSFGNPLLTPEFSNSFSLNYLKTWDMHTLSLSAYYRPTSDVIQRIKYQDQTGMMYQTNENVSKSQSSGLEMVLKNKFTSWFDLTTSANAYYYKLDGFRFNINDYEVTGEGRESFSWNARMMASFVLPWDMSAQLTGNYRSKQAVSQGERKGNYSVDLGLKKNFMNRKFVLSISGRDLFDSRKWETTTSSDSFWRHQKGWRGGRRVDFTLTWNFGNMKPKQRPQQNEQGDDDNSGSGYDMGGE